MFCPRDPALYPGAFTQDHETQAIEGSEFRVFAVDGRDEARTESALRLHRDLAESHLRSGSDRERHQRVAFLQFPSAIIYTGSFR